MTNITYRVAVIGCGAICGNHIKAILAAGQTLCALCDIDRTHAEAAAKKYALGEIPIYTDYLTLLEQAKPDAVHICTPHYLHAPMAIAALGRDIHVLCEKPLGISTDDLTALRAAAKKSRAQLGVCHQNRYEPNMLRLRELAKDGVSGACGYVAWKRDAAYYSSAAWRGTRSEEGGGVMINQALHTLDLLQWICGMPVAVTAHTFNDSLNGVIEVEDTATARFTLADGTVLNFFATVGAGVSFPVRLEVQFKDKSVVMAANSFFVADGAISKSEPSDFVVGKSVWGSGHKALITEFYHCLATDTHFPIDVTEGEKVIRLILSMYASNGETIAVLQ